MTAAVQNDRFIPRTQEIAYAYLEDNTRVKYIVYGGAAGGGKSWVGCEWLLQCCHYLPGTRWFIGRNNLKDTRESVVVTFGKVARLHNYTGFKTNDHGIQFTNGSEIIFLDLTFYPRKDPKFERFGSKEFTGGWIEEGGEVDFGAFDVLKARVGRHLNKEYGILPKIFITCNPKKNWLYKHFYKPWREGTLERNKAFVRALPKDNPFLTNDYIQNLHEITDKTRRQRLLLGIWEYSDDNTLVDFDAISDLFTNEFIKPDLRNKYITADIALMGSDLFVVLVWYGFVIVDFAIVEKSGGKEIIDTINDLRMKHQIRESNIVYDSDGIGGFIGGKGGFIRSAHAFVNGSPPLEYKGETENYKNLKAQCSYHLAEGINDGRYYFHALRNRFVEIGGKEVDLEEYVGEELEQLKRKNPDSDGKVMVEDKKIIKGILGRSPDFKDAIMLREYFELDIRRMPQIV